MSRAFQLMAFVDAELSMEGALRVALTDDTFHDVTLQGNDGVQVPANRTILGLRSLVFRKMLFGNFQEGTKRIVNVDYPGAVVKAVVEYIHTNKAGLLAELETSKGDEITIGSQEHFQRLLALTEAAAYYGQKKLCYVVQQCLSSHLNAFPKLVFPLLEAYFQDGPAISGALQQSALSKIPKLLMDKDFDPKILRKCSQTAVELVLAKCKALLSEQQCFLLIDLWRQAGSTDQDRGSPAKKLVKDHVDLQFIDPEYLSTAVTLSGLVTLEQLVEAYKSQAIQAKKKFKASSAQTHKSFKCPSPKWKRTRSATTDKPGTQTGGWWRIDTLNCPILLPGRRYRWTMKIHNRPNVRLGVVLSSVSGDVQGRGLCDRNIVGCYGFTPIAGVDHGDCVTMTLDLSSEEEYNGTLSISVNSQPTIRICADMHGKLPPGESQGFVPAVACGFGGCQVTIARIEEF